ncbi:MAG: hypothetical protein K6A65_08710, partial [Succinivibrionaceae bacterium]|nr:hypothetical protein [Succinivibrionaceae bacterium]
EDIFDALWKVCRDVLFGHEPSGSPSKNASIGSLTRSFSIYSNDSTETVRLIQKGAAFRNTVSVYKNIISLEGVGTLTVAIDPCTAAASFNEMSTKFNIPQVPPPQPPEGFVSSDLDAEGIKVPESFGTRIE